MTQTLLVETPLAPPIRWETIAPLEVIPPNSAVAAFIRGRQIALVRVSSGQADEVFAIANLDPFSGAMVMARGMVGDRAGIPMIVAPIYKQAFDLRTGRCLDDDGVCLPTYPARIVDGSVHVNFGDWGTTP